MAFETILQQAFDGRLDDRDHAIAVFREHVSAVQRTMPADRLLTYRVADGWEPLCRFLDTSVPTSPFPRPSARLDLPSGTLRNVG